MNMPNIKVTITKFDTFLEIIALLLLIFFWIFNVVHFKDLPETIPIHFNGSGTADGFGPRASIFALPIIGTIIYIGLTVLQKYPKYSNFPVKITEENAQYQYTNATKMLRVLKIIILILFFMIDYFTMLTAIGKEDGLGKWFLPFTLGILIVPIVYFFIQSKKSNKPKL
jgi:uncharacterized membrane protein